MVFPKVPSQEPYCLTLLYDLFSIMNKVDFASYADTRMADDNTPYVIGNGVKEASNEQFYWFADNQL